MVKAVDCRCIELVKCEHLALLGALKVYVGVIGRRVALRGDTDGHRRKMGVV